MTMLTDARGGRWMTMLTDARGGRWMTMLQGLTLMMFRFFFLLVGGFILGLRAVGGMLGSFFSSSSISSAARFLDSFLELPSASVVISPTTHLVTKFFMCGGPDSRTTWHRGKKVLWFTTARNHSVWTVTCGAGWILAPPDEVAKVFWFTTVTTAPSHLGKSLLVYNSTKSFGEKSSGLQQSQQHQVIWGKVFWFTTDTTAPSHSVWTVTCGEGRTLAQHFEGKKSQLGDGGGGGLSTIIFALSSKMS